MELGGGIDRVLHDKKKERQAEVQNNLRPTYTVPEDREIIGNQVKTIVNKMELKRFNAETSGGVKTGEPIVSFNKKAGLITISKTAAEALELKEGSRVSFLQHPENKQDWYMDTKDEKGFLLRANKEGGSLAFNNVATAKTICESIDKMKEAKTVIVPMLTVHDEEFGEGIYSLLTAKSAASSRVTKEKAQ